MPTQLQTGREAASEQLTINEKKVVWGLNLNRSNQVPLAAISNLISTERFQRTISCGGRCVPALEAIK